MEHPPRARRARAHRAVHALPLASRDTGHLFHGPSPGLLGDMVRDPRRPQTPQAACEPGPRRTDYGGQRGAYRVVARSAVRDPVGRDISVSVSKFHNARVFHLGVVRGFWGRLEQFYPGSVADDTSHAHHAAHTTDPISPTVRRDDDEQLLDRSMSKFHGKHDTAAVISVVSTVLFAPAELGCIH